MGWREWNLFGRTSEDEYRANLAGMNTFFGAVLGFVLADVETRSTLDFAQLLLFSATIVISILYVSASPKRWLYAALTLFFIWALPKVTNPDTGSVERLQVTLAVWTAMTIALEAVMLWTRATASRAPKD